MSSDPIFISPNINIDQYRFIIKYCCENASMFGFVSRNPSAMQMRGKNALSAFKKNLIEHNIVNEWPGTKLHGSTVSYYKYAIDSYTYDQIIGLSSRFDDWNFPEMPESIHFMCSNGNSLLETISHESIIYIFADKKSSFFKIITGFGIVIDCPEF